MVCITVKNSPNPSSVYIRLCKHRKKVFYCFYKITPSKNYNAGTAKKNDFTDQNVSSYNINLTMAFFNWPIITYIWKSGDPHVACLQLVYLRHTTMFTYSGASTPLGQSERAYYLMWSDIWNVSYIGHFPVHLSLHFKARLSATSLLWKSVFIHNEIGTNYHNKNFALRLALKERLRGTRKWPIELRIQYMKHFIYYFTSILHGLSRSHKWPAPNVSSFIAQLVRASHRYREVTGSNSVEVLTFSGFYTQLLKLRS